MPIRSLLFSMASSIVPTPHVVCWYIEKVMSIGGVVCWYIEKIMSIGASTQVWYVGI